MTYREVQRLDDIQSAIDAISSYTQRGELTDGMVFDAVRIRLIEIGEAVKALPPSCGRRWRTTCRSSNARSGSSDRP